MTQVAPDRRMVRGHSQATFHHCETIMNITQSTDLLTTWKTTLTQAEAQKDLPTLLAGEVAMLRLADELLFLSSEVETPVARDTITALEADITALTEDIAAAVDRLGRPSWTKRRAAPARECLDRAVEALDDARTAIIRDAVRDALDAIQRQGHQEVRL